MLLGMSTLWLPFSSPLEPPLTLKVELPYKREHDFQDSSEPQNDAFGTVILTPFCSQHPAKDCSSAPPPWQNLPSALRDCRIPPEVSPSLLWQSPWDHFGASVVTLAAPAAPFGAKTSPKVTLKCIFPGRRDCIFPGSRDYIFPGSRDQKICS